MTESDNIEWLDSDAAFGPKYKKVITQLNWINKYLGNESHTLRIFKKELGNSNLQKGSVVRVLDLGCASGYILHKIGELLIQSGYKPMLIGIDSNSRAIDLAEMQLAQYDHKLILGYVNADYLIPEVDFLLSTHFIYHLSSSALIDFLKLNTHKVTQGIVFSELRSNPWSKSLFGIFNRFSGFEKEVLQDGIKALKRAPTHEEFQSTFSAFKNLQVQKAWLFRTLIYGKL